MFSVLRCTGSDYPLCYLQTLLANAFLANAMCCLLILRLQQWNFWWWLSIPMLLSKWILRQNIRNMSGQTMSAWLDREFLQWRYLIKTIFNISKWATSRDIVIWLLQGTIYINMSIILSFNCGNAWTQWSHFYLRQQRRPWVYEPLLSFVRPDQRRYLRCVIYKADIIRKYKYWRSTISSISLKRTTTFSFNNMQTLHYYYITRIYISIKLLNLGF